MTKAGVLYENAQIHVSPKIWEKLISLRSMLADYNL